MSSFVKGECTYRLCDCYRRCCRGEEKVRLRLRLLHCSSFELLLDEVVIGLRKGWDEELKDLLSLRGILMLKGSSAKVEEGIPAFVFKWFFWVFI